MASKVVKPKACTSYSIDEDEDFVVADNEPDCTHLIEELTAKKKAENSYDREFKKSIAAVENQNAFETFESSINYLESGRLKSCASCKTLKRVDHPSVFKRGQHISSSGEYLKINVRQKQICPYDHHMIVIDVEEIKGNEEATLKVIHFTRDTEEEKKNTKKYQGTKTGTNEGGIKIVKATKTIHLANDDVYLVNYSSPKYTPNEVAVRAERTFDEKKGFKKYNLFTLNCEHFATWCVMGDTDSFQVIGLRMKIRDAVFAVFGSSSAIAKGIVLLLRNSSGLICTALSKFANATGFVLAGLEGLYLIYCIFKTALYIKDYKTNKICWSCTKKNLLDLWSAFMVFCVTSGVQAILVKFALPLIPSPVGIPLVIVVMLLSIGLQQSVSRITDMFRSPFADKKRKVLNINDIDVGDIVELKYFMLDHIVLVTEVHENSIMGIHYASPPSPIGKREVKEDKFKVDVQKSEVKIMETRDRTCYLPNVVVERGRKRLGETKFDSIRNRSSHLCAWAKFDTRNDWAIDDDYCETSKSKVKISSTLFVDKREVFLINELEEGDVVSFGVFTIGKASIIEKKGILINARETRRNHGELVLMVHPGILVRRETCDVNLNKDRIFVHEYIPARCKKKIERKKKAESVKGQLFLTTDRFIEHCILRDLMHDK